MVENKKGSSLVLVLVITLILFFLTAVVGTSMVAETKQALTQQRRTQAYYIARAGAAAAAKWLTKMSTSDPTQFNALTFPLSSTGNSFSNGTFNLEITKKMDQISVQSTGYVPNGTSPDVTDMVTSVLTSSSISDITTAVFGIKSVSIISYVNGDIGTNSSTDGAISFTQASKYINGSIYIPFNSTPNKVVVGSTDQDKIKPQPSIKLSASLSSYPSPIFPSYPDKNGLPQMGYLTTQWNTSPITANAYYDSITVQSPLIINISAGDNILRVGTLVVSGNIIINGSGRLLIYADNFSSTYGNINIGADSKKLILYCNNKTNLTLSQGIAINSSLYIGGNPTIDIGGGANITGDIVTTSDSLSMHDGATVVKGIIYAPKADIHLTGGININGAVIGNNIYLENGGEKITFTGTSIMPLNPIPVSSTNTGYTQYWK